LLRRLFCPRPLAKAGLGASERPQVVPVELPITRALRPRLQSGQVLRASLLEGLLRPPEISLSQAKDRQVHTDTGQFVGQVRLVRGTGYQWPPRGGRGGKGGFRFFQPARGDEQEAQRVVARCEVAAQLGSGGELVGQLLPQSQRLAIGLLRLLHHARRAEQEG